MVIEITIIMGTFSFTLHQHLTSRAGDFLATEKTKTNLRINCIIVRLLNYWIWVVITAKGDTIAAIF